VIFNTKDSLGRKKIYKNLILNTLLKVTVEDKWFQTSHLKNNLKEKSVKGGFSTIAGQVFSFVISISSTFILARLLLPSDYGLVAMVSAITGIVGVFHDLGLSSAVIQKEHIDQEQVSSVFWINAAISLLLAILISLAAPLLVYFYEEPKLLSITLVFAGSILFTGFSLQHNALMKRQMKFKALSLIQIISTVFSLIVGIVLAYFGFGYWALVAATILNPVTSSFILWIVCDWRPSITLNISRIRDFLRFGAGMTGFDLLNYFSRNMDNILIGKFAGSIALGLYSKAYQLLMLPINQLRNPLNAVALPVLSTLQSDYVKYANFYRQYLFALAFFSMPIVVYLGVYSEELVMVILGEQWTGAAYIFKILAIAAFVQPVISTQGLVLITTGKVNKYFKTGLVGAITLTTAFAIGIQWGVEGVAMAYSIVVYLTFLPIMWYCFRDSPVSIGMFFEEVAFPAVFSIICGLVLIFSKAYLVGYPDFFSGLIGFFIGAVTYLFLWILTAKSRNRLRNLGELIFLLKKKN
jgi:O-antigen/teichoic acid export membrane protein